jgi:hypothetical protein
MEAILHSLPQAENHQWCMRTMEEPAPSGAGGTAGLTSSAKVIRREKLGPV